VLGMSPQHVKGLIEEIAEGEKACRSSFHTAVFNLFKELDVEVNKIGSVTMRMCALGCEKELIPVTPMIANRALKKEHITWKSCTTSMRNLCREVSKIRI
jgi:hypothetical protein